MAYPGGIVLVAKRRSRGSINACRGILPGYSWLSFHLRSGQCHWKLWRRKGIWRISRGFRAVSHSMAIERWNHRGTSPFGIENATEPYGEQHWFMASWWFADKLREIHLFGRWSQHSSSLGSGLPHQGQLGLTRLIGNPGRIFTFLFSYFLSHKIIDEICN